MELQILLEMLAELSTLEGVVDLQLWNCFSQSLQFGSRHLQELLMGL